MTPFADKQRKSRNAFSLVELLTVLAIMSVLGAVTITSLSSTKSQGLSFTGNAVTDTINMARQNSVAQDAYTAIVIQKTGTHPYSTYCLIQLKRDPATGSYTSSTWQQLTSWRRLADGLVFDPTATVTNNFFASTDSLENAPASISYQGQVVDLTTANSAVFRAFRPDGSMDETDPLRLRIVNGTCTSAGVISYQGKLNAGVAANYYDILFLPDTGQTKIERPD